VSAQLRQYGVDISVLPEGGPALPRSDPVTGSPTQYALTSSCVSLITGSVVFIASYERWPSGSGLGAFTVRMAKFVRTSLTPGSLSSDPSRRRS
jgi:hypothetical protein